MKDITIGVVRGVHGLDGRLRVESLSSETTHFRRLRRVRLESNDEEREYAVEAVEDHAGGVLMKLQGIDSKAAATDVVGADVVVPRRRAARRRRGEYYATDLVGCRVTQGRETVGTVASVVSTGASDLLEVRRPNGELVLIPFVKAFVARVHTRRRRIALRSSWEPS